MTISRKRSIATLTTVLAGLLLLQACATATGTAAGAGVGALAGDAKKGAVIGGSVGAVVDIVD